MRRLCSAWPGVLLVLGGTVAGLSLPRQAAWGADATAASDQRQTIRMVFVGDIMLDLLPGKAVARGKDPFAPFASVLRDADITVGNLECVIAAGGEPIEGKPYTFRAHPRCVKLLAGYFDALSLANNHTGDFGRGAFCEQLERLKGRVPVFGGGRNVNEARTPLILQRNGIRVALLGYNEYHPHEFEAGPNWPGTAWLVEEQVLADIEAARCLHQADLVIPFLHWGEEGEPKSCKRQRVLARRMIDAGADLIVGSHPHITQGAEYYKGHLIVYSLGNFVFDFDPGPCRTGWILRLTLSKRGLVEWDTLVATSDDNGLPHPNPRVPSPFGKAGSSQIRLRKAE